MILYSIIILLGWVAVILLNVFLNPQYADKWWMYIILTIAFSVVAFIIDALVALIIRKLQNK